MSLIHSRTRERDGWTVGKNTKAAKLISLDCIHCGISTHEEQNWHTIDNECLLKNEEVKFCTTMKQALGHHSERTKLGALEKVFR